MSSSPWEPATLRRVFVVGVGMTKFVKPGAENSRDYPDLAEEAGKKALADAQIPYSAVDQACVGYVFGDSTCGQRAIYHSLGMTGIPIINVNNNCATGSTALFMARQLIQGGVAECVLALGFEKMSKGSLGIKFSDRTIPTDKHVDLLINKYGLSAHPVAPQMFGYAGKEHMEKYGTKIEHFAKIGWKNHKHSVNNPYSQFQDEYSLDEVMASKEVFDFLTILQCCPTSDGAAAAILASEAFVQKYGLQSKAVEILAQEMMTDLPSSFEEKSIIKMVGFDMSKEAARKCYEKSGLTPNDIDVIELHDCFSTNELLTYEALGLCPEGQGATLVDRGDNTYGGKWVINPSGGLISKGHPLGATGLAQCAELCWQLRGEAGKRQVPGAKVALQHNLGIGGAVVVTLYKMGFPEAASSFRTHQIEAVPTSSASDGFKANLVFKEIEKKLEEEGEQFVKKIGGIFAFKVKDGPGGKEATWVVDVKNGKGSVLPNSDKKADCTITMADSDFLALMTGKMNPQSAFFQGKLKITGNMGLAMKLQNLQLQPGNAKL
ncbi:sterol carrier protein 2 [Homo sapiens]|uniref:Sterol carrier protein 2 n=3 Tax=Homo sapiens TaxID=9606 RepID=SCP2_HUMAN|nr:sterol carrier protein 2 isoform 1 precursor [Homo sapiens]P22307.2 RecName: Full=Sterol carrier protein 2; Short=SCP-2; AltName: Full=Acetyl-CoA C-myristoyltransferase; AltName: Full=Non-specific lipid-transfer protein; Short=NSL-TP; AltName: Full=Propanoyl-CoA C-acyltransferase; AltName: Full=SCP-2/3-oxoacyl-CoA thiolase; AltName: Full=SCP-2/thiolase; AltName: Full=SCP-chi; AltName: Full=SCPX; AltName: Full=Sterol carrier protein X; Short=SCP-X [Homo sapiens]AAA03557.1 sterol carrier protein|eukprot:NP_002970.2 non-specific lipid-transfer protein isoform 1 precursor [Homo sapiens]